MAARSDTLKLLKVGAPMMVAQLSIFATLLIDLAMSKSLGTSAQGSVGLGATLFFSFLIFGLGLLAGIEFFLGSALGEKNQSKAQAWGQTYMIFSLGVALFIAATLKLFITQLHQFDISSSLLPQTKTYLNWLTWGLAPYFLYFVFRQVLACHQKVVLLTILHLVSPLINWGLNCWFLYGLKWGVKGLALGSVLTRIIMLLVLVFAVKDLAPKLFIFNSLTPFKHLAKALKIGTPIAFQMCGRSLAFSIIGVWVSSLGAIDMAAHSILLNIFSLWYMVPIGLSSATAILVSTLKGQKNREGIRALTNKATVLGMAFMLMIGTLSVLFNESMFALFSDDKKVLSLASSLTVMVASVMVFDAIQTILTGALRGMGQTFWPFVGLIGPLYILALPLAYHLRFMGLVGVWYGILTGLVVAALIFTLWWLQTFRLKEIKQWV